MKLSVAIIAHNEEEIIRKLLESVKDADEIVVNANGCTDNTVQICTEYTDKVYTDYKWIDNFADARNWTIAKATGDWVLCIDCDNELEPGGIKKIKNSPLLETKNALDVTWWCETGSHKLPWLFKRCKENYFIGAVHEYLSSRADGDSGVKIKYTSSPSHKYDPNRNIRILEKELAKNPDAVRERYYYAREFFYKGDWGKVVQEIDKYLLVSNWLPEKVDALYLKALCLWKDQKGNQAREVCLECIRQNPDFKKALTLMSEMHIEPWKSKWLYIANNAKNDSVLFC